MLDAVCVFSDGQDITGADEISSDIIDLEELGITDEQIVGWLNMIVADDVAVTGMDSGIEVRLRTCDNTNLTTTPRAIVSSGILTAAQMTAGAKFSWGFCAANCEKYMGIFYDVVSEQPAGTLNVSAWWGISPITGTEVVQQGMS